MLFFATNDTFYSPTRIYYVATDITSGITLNQAIKANNDYTQEEDSISRIVFDHYDSVENDTSVYTVGGGGYNLLSGLVGASLSWNEITVEIYRATNTDGASTVYILSTGDIICSADMSQSFRNFTALKEIDFNNFQITSATTNLAYMFYNCSSLIELDVTHFVTTNVLDMQQMFNGCSMLTSLDLSNFDTTNVTNMSHIFNNCFN